jgi:adhesin transport system membrane fusion protein
MLDPTKREGFDRIGRVIGKLERFGRSLTGNAFSRLLPGDVAQPRDWQSDAEWATHQQAPLRTRFLIYSIFVTFALLLGWSAFASLDEVVHGIGKAIPTSGTQVIQSVDGGVVEAILVKEAQRVEKDEVLLRIDPTRFTSSLGERRAQVMALMAKAARLEALTRGGAYIPSEEVSQSVPHIVEHERRLYQTSQEELNSRIGISRELAAQRRQELAEANARLIQVGRAYELAQEELQVTKPLLATGAVPQVEIMRLEKEVARARGDRDQARAQVSRTRAAIDEAEGQVREVELRYRNAWRNELSSTLRELESLTEGNRALADRVSHSDIRSPIRGTVKRFFVNTPGAVVMPGGMVAEIVPEEDMLVVETQLSPKDRAFIRPGQAAVVKFTAYEYAVYGGLEGVVEHIGPDTITDEKGNTYYLARIRTHKPGFGKNLPILPGMVAQVDILTGKKTVLSYLLKPLFRAKANALREH